MFKKENKNRVLYCYESFRAISRVQRNNAKYRPDKLRGVRQTGAILVSQVGQVVLAFLSSAYLSLSSFSSFTFSFTSLSFFLRLSSLLFPSFSLYACAFRSPHSLSVLLYTAVVLADVCSL